VKSHHLTMQSLEYEFIDHICCEVEELMSEGKSFKLAFDSIQQNLGDEVLISLEKQTIYQLTYNQRVMKFMTRLTGIIVLLSFFAAIIAKTMGMSFWTTLMAGGMVVLCAGFAPLYFIEHYQQQEIKSQKILHILGFFSAFLIPLSAFMVLFNSPYALQIMFAGVLFLVVGFIPLSFISVDKGEQRKTFTGSILVLLFFVLLSFGFIGVKISKDRIDSWIFISSSGMKSTEALENLNADILSQMKTDSISFSKGQEIKTKTDELVASIAEYRLNFILSNDSHYDRESKYFSNMDNHFAGEKYLIKPESSDKVLVKIQEYEKWLLTQLSTESEQTKLKISQILLNGREEANQDFNSQKNYLFRDFPSIADVAVINSIMLNVRLAENQALQQLAVAGTKL